MDLDSLKRNVKDLRQDLGLKLVQIEIATRSTKEKGCWHREGEKSGKKWKKTVGYSVFIPLRL